MKRFLLFSCLLGFAAAALAQGLEVIQLRNRSAEQVLPVLRGLVEPGGAVTGQGYQLFVRTSPANRDELKQALAALDTPLRRLVISVRFDNSLESAGTSIDARIASQRFPSERAQVEARAQSGRSAAEERVDQRVQVLEGSRALISKGQSRPLPQRQVFTGPGGTLVRETTVVQNVDTGFEVTPHVSGGTVHLEIHPQRESAGPHGTVQSQRVSSTVAARLGEWVELGSGAESSNRAGSGILYSRGARQSHTQGVWVRVEELRP